MDIPKIMYELNHGSPSSEDELNDSIINNIGGVIATKGGRAP